MIPYKLGILASQQRSVPGHLKQAGFAGAFKKRPADPGTDPFGPENKEYNEVPNILVEGLNAGDITQSEAGQALADWQQLWTAYGRGELQKENIRPLFAMKYGPTHIPQRLKKIAKIELTPEEEEFIAWTGASPETARQLFSVAHGSPPPTPKKPSRHWKDVLGVRYRPL